MAKKRNLYTIKKNIYTMAMELPVFGEWLTHEEIRKIESDSTINSSIIIRKGAILKKELFIDCNNKLIKSELEKIINVNFRQQVLDVPYQGLIVFELNWYFKNGYLFPKPIERDYQEFAITPNGKLFYTPLNLETREDKIIYTVYNPKFHSLTGRPLYNTLFWLRRFKTANLEFWIEFMERFGKPWVVGKTQNELDLMAEQLYAMVGGDVAVIDSEDSIDLKTPATRGEFLELSTYLDNQIRETILGGNLLGEVQRGSYSAAQVHSDIKDEIANGDQILLEAIIKQLVDIFKEKNSFSEEIIITIKDKDDPNSALADRDLKISQMIQGKYTFTKEYLEKTYNIELEESNKKNNFLNKFYSLKNFPKNQDVLDSIPLNTKEDEELILKKVEEVFDSVDNYEEALKKLETLNVNIDFYKLFANSEILGISEIEDEV